MKINDVHPKIIEELKKYPREVQELVIDALQSFSQGFNQVEVQRKLENRIRRILQEEAQR